VRYRQRSAMSFEEFQELLGQMLDEIPPPLLEELSGGVLAEKRTAWSEEHPDLVLLGQYLVDPYLGRLIVLYYGSFVRAYGADRERWVEEMRRTLRHEIRHHVESRAGVRDLELEDAREVRRFLEGLEG